jgi:hypothetical protein
MFSKMFVVGHFVTATLIAGMSVGLVAPAYSIIPGLLLSRSILNSIEFCVRAEVSECVYKIKIENTPLRARQLLVG